MKATLSNDFTLLVVILFFLCTNEDVVFTPPTDCYETEIAVTDSSSGTILIDSVYPGQRVLFTGTILKGDTSKVTPLWNIAPSARYQFYYTFTSAGDFPVIFTIRDAAGFELYDTLMVHTKKVDNALISGRAFLYWEKDNRNIRVIFRTSDLHDTVFVTDSTGQYARCNEIAPGIYTMIAEETRTGYIYIKDSLCVNIVKGNLNQIPDLTLKWSYAMTPSNVFLPNDTIITPYISMDFPVDITDMHESKVNIECSISLNNSQKQSVLNTTKYTFNDCGTYGILIRSIDSLHNTDRNDIITVYATWEKQNFIIAGDSAKVIAGSTALLVSNRNRKTGGIKYFSWDFNGDGKYEKDTALSSNTLYTSTIPGDYTAVCRSQLKNGTAISDSFFIRVLSNNVSDSFTYLLKVRDILTNDTIVNNQIVFAGKELSFTAEFTKGDTTKVKPLWRVGNSGSDTINAFSFRRSFKDTGFVSIVFSIQDSTTDASCKDTFNLFINNVINGGAVRGKALYKDKNNHNGIIIQVMSAGTQVCSLYTDSSGLYNTIDGIPQGTYDLIAHDNRIISEYIPDTVKNVTINYGMFSTENMILKDITGPHFSNITPSNYLFNDSLVISAQLSDQGAGVDRSSFVLIVNDSVVNRTHYTIDGPKLLYSSKPGFGNYDIKAVVKDSAGNISDTITWAFSRVDTSDLVLLHSGDSIEISINDSVLFFPSDKWLNEKTHTFVVSLDEKILVDSLNFKNAKYVFKTEGNYTIRYAEFFQGKELQNGISRVIVIKDAPSVSLSQDTVISLNTSITLKSKIYQKFGKIIVYEWKAGNSVIASANSDSLIIQPESLLVVKRPYILNCIDDDNNCGSDTINVSFGTWVVVGNKGFTDTADFQSITICNGTPYVAYHTNPMFKMYLHCMMFSGNTWVAAGDTIEKLVCPFSINSTTAGPVIAYCDMRQLENQVGYAAFKGDVWEKDTTLSKTDFKPDVLDSNALCLQIHNSVPYIAYASTDDSTGYLVRRHLGKWEKVTDNSFTNGHASYVRLQFLNESACVSYLYSSGTSNDLYVKMLNSNQWSVIGVGSVQNNVFKYSFCMNNDIPCIATISNDNHSLSIKCFTNNQWKDISSPYDGTCSYLSLHSFKNHLFIAYNVLSDQNRAIVKMFDGDNWIDAGYVSGGASQFISIASDSSNLYVAYADGQYDYRTTVMQLK